MEAGTGPRPARVAGDGGVKSVKSHHGTNRQEYDVARFCGESMPRRCGGEFAGVALLMVGME